MNYSHPLHTDKLSRFRGLYGKSPLQKPHKEKDHLGNVLATVSDKKVGEDRDGDNKVDGYWSQAMSVQTYYPFGWQISSKSYNYKDMRFDFNDKETDRELVDWQNYGERMYMKRIARFNSVDPLNSKYPWLSAYQFASNSPIKNLDLDGLEKITYTYRQQKNSGKYIVTGISTDYSVEDKIINVKAYNMSGENVGCFTKSYQTNNYDSEKSNFQSKLDNSESSWYPNVDVQDVKNLWESKYSGNSDPTIEIDIYDVPNPVSIDKNTSTGHVESFADYGEYISYAKKYPERIHNYSVYNLSKAPFAKGAVWNANTQQDNKTSYNFMKKMVGEKSLLKFEKQRYYKYKGFVEFQNDTYSGDTKDSNVSGDYNVNYEKQDQDP